MVEGAERGRLPPPSKDPGLPLRVGACPPSSSPSLPSSQSNKTTHWNKKIDVGKLISDLDDDIRASEMVGSRENSPPRSVAPNHASPAAASAGRPQPAFATQEDTDKGLKMKIKRTKSGRQEIVKTEGGGVNGNFDGGVNDIAARSGSAAGGPSPVPASTPTSGGGIGGGLPLNSSSRPSPMGGPHSVSSNGPPSSGPSGPGSSISGGSSSGPPSSGESGPNSPQMKSEYTAVSGRNGGGGSHLNPLTPAGLQQLTTAKLKVDAGTLTDASTLTEPEMLGPCEPGTAVNLDGIVWHETDTGVLVVNITWRGKTYVGTLLDCARHTNQWSAPRFTDSPEPGGKGGRGKRGRTTSTPLEPEPRKNLRSQKGKGKGGKGNSKAGSSAAPPEDEFNFPAPASPAKDGVKRKKESDTDESKKRKRTSSDSDDSSTPQEEAADAAASSTAVVPVKREPKMVVYSYKMLECPRKECSKQYKHDEGLKWHVSHSHPEFIGPDGEIRDVGEVEREEQERRRKKERSKEEKEEQRKKKEARQESSDRGTPAKQQKLDDSKASTPSSKPVSTTSATPASATPSTPQTQRPGSLSVRPPLNTPPTAAAAVNGGSRLPADLAAAEDLKLKGKLLADSPAGLGVGPALPPTPVLEREKPAANSPAYSDISDDGEDSRGKDLKLPQGINIPPASHTLPSQPTLPTQPLPAHPLPAHPLAAHHLASQPLPPPHNAAPLSLSSSIQSTPPTSSTLAAFPPPAPSAPQQPIRSSPMPRTEVSSSVMSGAPRTSSYAGVGMGPQPGTPEYHKYLAANGFPPFPYPSPVGMDPNYHIQLLKTDPAYKAKWEKDRADRERAFKEQLDKDQGKFSGLSLIKEDRLQPSPQRKATQPPSQPQSDPTKPEDLRKREASGDSRPRSRASPMTNMISVKPEFREKEEVKREVKAEEGVKPTMETRGPPPGPQTFGYMHPSLIRPPYSLGMPLPPHFDPAVMSAAGLSPYGIPPLGLPSPYAAAMSPGLMASVRQGVPFSVGDPLLRSPFSMGAAAEELARAAAAGAAPPGLSGPKALDMLQQHASQYYANQKLAELQERALKSPISSLPTAATAAASASISGAPPGAINKPITTLAGKDSPTLSTSTSSKSPPPLRHVHTHTHTHIGLGYPLLPPGALPPVPSGLPPVGSLPPGALPPPTIGGAPFSSTASAYPGKSPS